MKKDAWLNIENEFNCQSIESSRTAAVLKNKYENIKSNVKKQYAEEKLYSRGTGGGPAKLFPISSVSNTVGELLQSKMTGEKTIYDSDNFIDTLKTHENIHYIIEDEDEQIVTITKIVDFPCNSDNTTTQLITNS